ncbi:Importin-7 [Taenia crassiceps]|uniref:Importin-7 n=1 Tax=Taenia crassiceps TaxID=6207 RepID=A0ABR4QUX6_9CEST
MHKIIGFAPTLLQIVLEQSLDLSVRQAGAVFLKNMILNSWRRRGPLTPDEPIPFQIHENDKAHIRNVVVPAVASSAIPIQSILQVAVSKILKFDFPSRFPNFVDQITSYLDSMNFREFHGALLCLHGLVQAYEHKANDKGPLPQTMSTLLPLLYHRMNVLLSDSSDESLTLQKLILKIFYRYTDYYLPTSSINEEVGADFRISYCSGRNDLLLIRCDVIVPLLSFTKELAELWEDDPLEYIRYNTSMYMSVDSPSDAAASFVKEACLKRKGILDKAIQYCTEVLNHDYKLEVKDGALHLIGTVCNILLKDKVYKEQLENFLAAHVLSLFEAPEGYRRARACWLVGKLSRAQFSNVDILCQIAMVCRHLMCSDSNLPVRVVAATTIFSLIKYQKEVEKTMNAHLPELVMQLLKLLRETEFDDLNSVLREVLVYSDELQPISVQMLQHLSGTFVKLVGVQENGVGLVSSGDSERDDEFKLDEAKEYQSLVATGVMENIATLVSVMEDSAELVASSESVVVQLVQVILKNEIADFYDEAFSLAFSSDASDCFVSMAPSLHNYITVDPKSFVASPDRVKMFISMCAQEVQTEEGQADGGVHAAKLLEVFVLNFRGQLDSFIPEVIEPAIACLTRKSTILELRIRCLLVVIAAIITSSATVLPILCSHMWPETQTPIIENILKVWIDNIQKFNGLHDRRVCVFGMCTLLSLSADQRPPAVDAIAEQYLPSLLHVLTSLKDAYAAKREMEKEEESDSDDDGLVDEDADGDVAVDSDTDVIDEEGTRYLELLEAVEAQIGDSDDEDDDDDDDDFEAASVIESFETELDKEENEMDEYVTFYQLMTQMETGDSAWYQRLVSPLSDSEKSEFKEIAKTAVNCIAQKESKRIEKAGGYNFQQTDVPSSFNFSGDQSPH